MNQPASASVKPPMPLSRRDSRLDPDLAALPDPPKREKRLAAAMMGLTAVVALAMCWTLRSEVVYAFQKPIPIEIHNLATWHPDPKLANHYVRAKALLSAKGAIRYERPFEGDSFRLQPVAGNPRVWVEVRVPEGMEGPRFVPPVSMVGRLVPLDQAGIRHHGLRSAVEQYANTTIPQDAWLLVDGASPRASRWAVALAALFAVFAVWNLVQLVRIVRPVHND